MQPEVRRQGDLSNMSKPDVQGPSGCSHPAKNSGDRVDLEKLGFWRREMIRRARGRGPQKRGGASVVTGPVSSLRSAPDAPPRLALVLLLRPAPFTRPRAGWGLRVPAPLATRPAP